MRIATLGSARILRIDALAGVVQPGRAANLVVLAANPLETISATRVVHDGVLHAVSRTDPTTPADRAGP